MSHSVALTAKDFVSDQEVRWCPGCGDYAILKAVQGVFPTLGLPKEKMVVISGIGCSSRFPYYMDTYGFHTIHGRAPAIATGLKVSRSDLDVWVITGDGDALSIGGNHLIHALRRNVGLKILLFNNRIYGLTKGQYSPTSEVGKKTSSTPYGSVDTPFNPLTLVLGAGATFVARSVDFFLPHLKATLERAARHQGTAFVEILQNCNIFNDGAFTDVTAKEHKKADVIYLEHDQPVVFGEDDELGMRVEGGRLEKVELGDGLTADDCLVWDETDPNLAMMMARLEAPKDPTPVGVIRSVEEPSFESRVVGQIQETIDRQGTGTIEDLLHAGDTWKVEATDAGS